MADIAHINLARGFRGGERQTELLARELARHGFRQRVIGRRGEPLVERCAAIDGVEAVATGGIVGAARAVRGARLAHAHEGRCVQSAALARQLGGTPYVITRRVMRPLRPRALTRWMYRSAAARVGISNAIGKALDEYTGAADAQVIPSAFTPTTANPADVARLRERFGTGPVIGHVGALIAHQKNQPHLIELARRHPGWRVVLVGSGPDEDVLRRQADGLANVLFTGQVSDVANHVAAFDLFVFPSLFEGLGSILLDAMYLGVPVVAADTGGIPDLVRDGETGTLVPPGDLDALDAAVARELADDARRTRHISQARQIIDEYSPAAMGERYAALYKSLIG